MHRLLLVVVGGVLAAVAAAASAGCGDDSGPKAPPTVVGTATPAITVLPRIQLRYGGGNLIVEVATTAEQSDRGLGYRDSLFERGGMLFDLHQTTTPVFWMKGMRFALDMVWIGEDKKVIAVTANVPPEPGVADAALKRYSPPSPARWVLELNAGAAAMFGIAAGTELGFDIPATLSGTPTVALPATSVPGLPPTAVIGAR